MSGNILSNIKKMYSDIMEFEKVDEAAHHVPLDKPLEIVDIIKKRLF
jgi:D-tyrosyl-tRNA(Tyr) deacylase